jgi:hypothetical protein
MIVHVFPPVISALWMRNGAGVRVVCCSLLSVTSVVWTIRSCLLPAALLALPADRGEDAALVSSLGLFILLAKLYSFYQPNSL